MIRFSESPLDAEPLPWLVRIVQGRDADLASVLAWAGEHRAPVLQRLTAHGAVLLRGFHALDGAAPFNALLGVLAPELMDYVGGSAPRHAVLGKVMTATDLPPAYSLALHQEMAYTARSPQGIAFFCETPPDGGGQTTVADARVVTARLDPALRARFDAQGVRVCRALPSPAALSRKPGIPKAWPDVFGTSDPDEVRRIALSRGWDIEWLPDGSLQLLQELLPGFRSHVLTGERVWFNQAHYHTPECTLAWAERDARQQDAAQIRRALVEDPQLLDRSFHGDGSEVSSADAHHIWHTLMSAEVPVTWQAGDVLLLDNVLAMHGRRAFSGRRRILAALIRQLSPQSAEPAGAGLQAA